MIRIEKPLASRQSVDLLSAIETCPEVGELTWSGRNACAPDNERPRDIDDKAITWPSGQETVGLWDRYLARLNHATVISNDGFIRLNNGSFISSTHWIPEQLQQHPMLGRYRSRVAIKKPGIWFSMLLFWGTGYYHWFCDVLPRLHKVLSHLPAETKFLLPKDPTPWMCDSLRMLGISRDKCIEYDSRFAWRLETLMYSPPVGMTGDIDPDAMSWLQDQLCPPAKAGPARRLYISRQRASCRSVVNETELLAELRNLDVQIVEAETLSLREQCDTFGNAELIIAPHGAGLTNVVWVQSRCKILELFEPNTIRRCYWNLAVGLNHEYRGYIAESVANPGSEANLLVDAPKVASFASNFVLR